MIRLTHIYTHYQANIAIEQAFKHGMELYYTANGTNEMVLAASEDRLFSTILVHLIKNYNHSAKHLGMLKNLHKLVEALP